MCVLRLLRSVSREINNLLLVFFAEGIQSLKLDTTSLLLSVLTKFGFQISTLFIAEAVFIFDCELRFPLFITKIPKPLIHAAYLKRKVQLSPTKPTLT